MAQVNLCAKIGRAGFRNVASGWPWWPKPPPIPSKKNIRKTTYSIYNIHIALRVSMEEKRLECLMMLQIHRSDTTDAVIDPA